MGQGADVKAQAVYDLHELAERMGMSTQRARRYLEKQGVPVARGGKGTLMTVLLSDLRTAFPGLYASLEEAAHIRGARC